MPSTNLHPIAVVGGKTYRIALDAPSRGEIKKALVVQTGAGTKEGFEYTFYDSAAGCPPGVDNDAATDLVKEAKAQVCATKVVATGKDRYEADGGFGSAGSYANADGGHSDAKRKLYMKLKVLGTGNKEFGVFLGIQVDKG